jgi:hypothetical protein
MPDNSRYIDPDKIAVIAAPLGLEFEARALPFNPAHADMAFLDAEEHKRFEPQPYYRDGMLDPRSKNFE